MVKPYLLEYIEDDPANPLDVTSVVNISKITHVGTGEINSAQMMISTVFGQHVRDAAGGTRPIIDQFSRFRLTMIDDDSVTYPRILITDTLLPQQSKRSQVMNVEFFGRERFLQKMKFPGHFFFIPLDELARRIVSFYNENRGSRQPRLVIDATEFLIPGFAIGTFDFQGNTSCYDALMAIISQLNLALSAQGAGDFYELLFEDDPANIDDLRILIMPQGSRRTTPVTGKAAGTRKILEVKEPVDATIVVCEGQADTGSLPVDVSRWTSLIEEYRNFPAWNSRIAYEGGIRVTYQGQVYRSRMTSLAGTLPTDANSWAEESLGTYIGGGFQYSPWTHDKASVYRTLTTNPAANFNVDFNSPAFPDSNVVVRDVDFWRDGVDFRVRRVEDIPVSYRYPIRPSGGTTPFQLGLYEGMRVLIDTGLGPNTGMFAGTDKNGNAFANGIAQLDRDGDWIVIRTPNPAAAFPHIQMQRFNEVMVRRATPTADAGVYEYDAPFGSDENDPRARRSKSAGASALGWQKLDTTFWGYDCLHYPSEISCVPGLVEPVPEPFGGNFTDDSALRVVYEYGETQQTSDFWTLFLGLFGITSLITAAVQTTLDILTSRETYNYGWWATLFEVPFPPSDHGISEDVGQLFGGTIDRMVPVLDLNNYNLTPTGKTGYGADDAYGLGPLTGVHFLFRFDIQIGDVRFPFVGDLPFRLSVEDTESNVWISDIVQRHLGETQQIYVPFSGFSVYRARRPIGSGFDDVLQNILVPELSILEVFERRKVKRITLQLQTGYDSFGRYQPATLDNFIRGFASNLIDRRIRLIGDFDALSFTKKPIAIRSTGADELHLMSNTKQYPNVSNVEQLGKIAQAELDLAQHRKDTFSITTDGKCDIRPGDSVLLNEQDLVEDSDGGGRKLAVRKVTYHIQTEDGTAGFDREISAYRRINA